MLTVVLLWWMGAQAPAAAPPVPSSDVANRAQAWLLATYPALRRGDLAIQIYGDAETMRLEVTDEPSARAPGPRAPSAPVLVVDLHATKDGRVEYVTATGPLVQSAALASLKAQVAMHPAWTNEEVDAAIAAAGGQYGSTAGAAVLAQTPPASALLDAATTMVSASAFARTDPRGPVWTVDVSTPTRTYQVVFEPVGGQLIGVKPK
jgi:hypothetical protein